ncbi:F-box/LRR-repeat protein 12 [Geodia barretti]|uniref:F-box/LRR-repeat protein 12 n=1 Tax=Geodia barretti TaxID=519541 RepID=A0AA35WAB0_GEOBA|nr:F-box/LRR-repeat protein 12 [Geodia barretti]
MFNSFGLSIAVEPSLSLLPDNVVLKIMSFLDVPSMMSLARINRRFYLLHSDEYIWSDVDLSTVPKLDVQRMKKFIREKLHPALWRLTLRSNAIECQRRPKMRPIITGAALDELFKKCPNIQTITLDNVDLSQLPPECLLWSSSRMERITFSRCVAPFKWLEKAKPHWPNLKHLYLPYTTKTSDHDLQYLASLRASVHPPAPTLIHLSLTNCYRIGKAGIQSICDSFPNLVMLDVSDCSGLTPECLLLIAEHMIKLKELNISNSVAMDSLESADTLLSKLRANCTHLQQLTLSPGQLYFHDDRCSEINMVRLNQLRFKVVFV